MNKAIRSTIALLVVFNFISCQESELPLPPKDISQYITALEDGNTWVTAFEGEKNFPQVIDGDTVYCSRKLYMTNMINGDTIVDGKKRKLYHTYFHHTPTIEPGDTVYTSDRCPQIFPDAVYMCGSGDILYQTFYYEIDHPNRKNIYCNLMVYAHKAWETNPSIYYEDNYTIKMWGQFNSYFDKWDSDSIPIISLNLTCNDTFRYYKITNVSDIQLNDNKIRRKFRAEYKREKNNDAPGGFWGDVDYWIEGLGSIRHGINSCLGIQRVQPTNVNKVISFTSHGQVIYTAEEDDLLR